MRRTADGEGSSKSLPPLPQSKATRPHAFFQLSIDGRSVDERIVVEVFDDVAGAAASHFLTRCGDDAKDSFSGTSIHKLLTGLALFGGKRNTKYVPVKFNKIRCSVEVFCLVACFEGDYCGKFAMISAQYCAYGIEIALLFLRIICIQI